MMMVFLASEFWSKGSVSFGGKQWCQLVKTHRVLAGRDCEGVCTVGKWFKTVSWAGCCSQHRTALHFIGCKQNGACGIDKKDSEG